MKALRIKKVHQIFVLGSFLLLTACNKADEFYEKSDSLKVGDTSVEVDGGASGGSSSGGSSSGGSSSGGSSSGGSSSGGSSSGGSSSGGAQPQQAIEEFTQTQTQQKKVDFLWVIDDSGSMQQEQDNLAANFSSFISSFIAKNVDFKMAITTTDTQTKDGVNRCGKIVSGSDTKLTTAKALQNQSQFLTDFSNLIKVGLAGSGSERGLRASECFINNHAATQLRPEAFLVVVYVSDEEDQSTPKAPSEYVSILQSVKANPGLVKAYSIVNTTGQTFGQQLSLGYQRYADVALATQGSYHDIFSNFGATLGEIGDQIINLLDSFPLEFAPIAGSVVVKVNNVVAAPSSYVVENSSVKFNAGFIPAAGATISVEYQH